MYTWLIQPSAHQAVRQNLARRQRGQLTLADMRFTYMMCVLILNASEGDGHKSVSACVFAVNKRVSLINLAQHTQTWLVWSV